MSKKRHIVFLQALSSHSAREVCLGAAENAARRAGWLFDPWPFEEELGDSPSRADFELTDGIITSEQLNQHLLIEQNVKIPRVLFLTDQMSEEAPSIGLDEAAIGKMAAEHLFVCGYRQLAFIGSSDWRWSKGRREGFTQAAQRLGLTVIVHEFGSKELPVSWDWNVVRRNESLLPVLESLPKPCGVFCANDVIACFFVQAARRLGYRVPEDFGVVGCDNDPLPITAAGLALSSVQPDFREVGRRCLRLLADLLNGKSVSPRTLVPPVRVAVRASTDVFRIEDPLVRRVQKYIEEHRHEPLRVTDVVRALGTHRMTLGKHFQRHLDVSLQEYILKRRIEHACDQLRDSRRSIEEIADACGFSSGSYFSRVFKKITGNHPGQFRQQR